MTPKEQALLNALVAKLGTDVGQKAYDKIATFTIIK